MNGRIVAVNRNLGVLVVETATQSCVVLEAKALLSLIVGEDVDGDWNAPGQIVVQNLTSGGEFQAHVQKVNVSRGEAVGSVSLF